MSALTLPQAIETVLSLIQAAYGNKARQNAGGAFAWAMILEGSDPDDLVTAAMDWCKSGKEWPPSASELRRKLPGNCRCGELSCTPCRRRRVEAITRGPTKRLYGSGGAYPSPPDWASRDPKDPYRDGDTPLLDQGDGE